MRKIMALGDELGADHDVKFTARDRLDLGAQTLRAARKIRGQGEKSRLREQV